MGALENAKKLSGKEVVEKIAELDIQEYGLCRMKLADRLTMAAEESREENRKPGVIAALNNADTDFVLLDVLKVEPERVMEGIAIAAYALETEKIALYIPEQEAALLESLKDIAAKYRIELQSGIVNVRAAKGCALLHIVTAAYLSDAWNGVYEPGIYVSANGGKVKKYAYDTKISDILDVSNAKALLLGYKYHVPKDAELTVKEADIANGVVRVLTEKDCLITETEKQLLAARKQSCGKCVFCREGLIQLEYMHKEIKEGRGKMDYLELAREIGQAMCISTPCTMGQVCAQNSLSASEHFADEYEAHIKKKNCPAGACTSFVNIYIDPQACDGCGECMDVCPKDCITGKPKYIHMIDDFDCTKCGKCMEACPAGAICKTTGKLPKLPNRLTRVGKFMKR